MQNVEITRDYYKEKNKQIERGEKKLCENVDKSNKIIKNEYGNLYLQKSYENSCAECSGVLIMFNVTVKLPHCFFDENNNAVLELTNLNDNLIQNPLTYRIGVYNEHQHTITYEEGTELLSCPFFMLFLKLRLNSANLINLDFKWFKPPKYKHTRNQIYNLKTGTSFENMIVSDMESRQMLKYFTNSQIFEYFQEADTLINLDLTCGAFVIPRDIIATKSKEISRFPNTVENRYIKKNIYGGKTRKKHQLKKTRNKYKHRRNKYTYKYKFSKKSYK